MSIRSLFNATWDQVYQGAILYGDTDILKDQRTIIVNRNLRSLIWGQLIMMFDDQGKMNLITSRFRMTILAIPAYLHTLEQIKRLNRAGIVCTVAFEKGLVTCTYSRVGWLERAAQSCSYSSPSVPKTQVPPQQTQFEENMVYNSPKT